MLKFKLLTLALATSAALTLAAVAEDSAPKPAAPAPETKAADAKLDTAQLKPDNGETKRPAKQADVASATATFGKVAKTNEVYKSALDAHALEDALKMVAKEGAFKGTVAKLYEPRGLVIVEFDENYKTALTAVLRTANFTNFPALTNLIGKEVLVTGKFIKYRESAEIVLTNPEQIKVVEAETK